MECEVCDKEIKDMTDEEYDRWFEQENSRLMGDLQCADIPLGLILCILLVVVAIFLIF